jgi:hypothetical protein
MVGTFLIVQLVLWTSRQCTATDSLEQLTFLPKAARVESSFAREHDDLGFYKPPAE